MSMDITVVHAGVFKILKILICRNSQYRHKIDVFLFLSAELITFLYIQ